MQKESKVSGRTWCYSIAIETEVIDGVFRWIPTQRERGIGYDSIEIYLIGRIFFLQDVPVIGK